MQVSISDLSLLPSPNYAGGSSDSTTTLDATTDYVAFCIRLPATGTIDSVAVRLGSGTLTGTLSCQVQTLDASGDPSGTAYGSSAQVDSVNPTASTTITFSGLGCSATAGDEVAIKVWASTVTSGSCSVGYGRASTYNNAQNFPYVSNRTTGTGVGTHANTGATVSVAYSGDVYYDIGCDPSSTTTTDAVDSDSTVKRLGNAFTLAVPVTAYGIWAFADYDQTTTALKLYDTDGTTVLATATITPAYRGSTFFGTVFCLFDSGATVKLNANTASPYRAVIETTSTTTNAVQVRAIQNISAAAAMGQLSMGENCYYTAYNTSWAETTTKRSMVGILIGKLEDGLGYGLAGFNLGGLA